MPTLSELAGFGAGTSPLGLLSGAVDERTRYYANIVRGLLDNPAALVEQLRAQNAENVRERARDVQDTKSVMPQVADPAKQAAFDEAMNVGLLGIVSPQKAAKLNTITKLPDDELFRASVANTPGAAITNDGLLLRVQRNQLPEQAQMESVRGGVFYLPEGAQQAKHYSTGRNGYGGADRIKGETLVKNPLFVKGATGGKAPESAFDSLMGKGAYQKMREDALNVNWGRRGPPDKVGPSVDDFLNKYAPEMSGMGPYILENSKKGNQLAYALQEAAVGSAVRRAGHDAVIGYSKGKSGPFISEIFDVRESHYPSSGFEWSRVWDSFEP